METQERILLAAAQEFAENGFRGATMRKISRRAGVNHAGINYHFKSKEDLYGEVVAYLFREIGLQEPEAMEVGHSLEERIFAWTYKLLSAVTDGRRLTQWKDAILFREMVEPTKSLKAFHDQYFKPELDKLRSLLAEGMPDAEQRKLYIALFSTVAQCVFFKQNRVFVDLLVGPEFYDEPNMREIAAVATRNVIANFERKPPCA